ncbi:hypothetical protein SISNIDRAFT_53844 [Sistotremastrum niveocremeum HHB9708]|uniref:Uncharacterized protein n=1 Tax=Sistotremastrum niveocremeum HHB9708 TaxID=1314777 RepID=A0A164V8X1_9AGAM|nr:hypothetical protein SISNIDRAFT_53844 [Sistotremastrum niveocremeum HHB9708]
MGTILRKPWLLDYLLGVAREFGGEPAPLSEQKRLVQIVKFITGPTERNPNPFEIWTEVSDGTHFIPARLSSAAVDRHLQDHGERISACKTGYFSIKQYRPFLTHVPTGVNDEIESMARLALEIESVGLIGSKGEPPFGDLTLVTAEERMRRWTGGLLKDQGRSEIY